MAYGGPIRQWQYAQKSTGSSQHKKHQNNPQKDSFLARNKILSPTQWHALDADLLPQKSAPAWREKGSQGQKSLQARPVALRLLHPVDFGAVRVICQPLPDTKKTFYMKKKKGRENITSTEYSPGHHRIRIQVHRQPIGGKATDTEPHFGLS